LERLQERFAESLGEFIAKIKETPILLERAKIVAHGG
jgi:hypothetical protein